MGFLIENYEGLPNEKSYSVEEILLTYKDYNK